MDIELKTKDISILKIVSQWRNEYDLYLYLYWLPNSPDDLFIGILVTLDNTGHIGEKPGLFFQSLNGTPEGKSFPSLHKDITCVSPIFLVEFLCGLGFECYTTRSVYSEHSPLFLISRDWEVYTAEREDYEALPIEDLISHCAGHIPSWLQLELQLIKDKLPENVADSLASFVIVDSVTIS